MFIKNTLISLTLVGVTTQLVQSKPNRLSIREVPQEHSHEQFLRTVKTSLLINNPLNIIDPVFGLLGNAAAAGGTNKVDPTCIQLATADQAFTNAKAAKDIVGMTAALVYRALERNTGSVGVASVPCTKFTAVNPQIAALSQHQDPASPNAASINKAITLELAKQIASIGGDPQTALKSGTFAPGTIGDNTARGHTCDDGNDAVGCIFTQNLIVLDATPEEINAAVAGKSSVTAPTAVLSASLPSVTSESSTSINDGEDCTEDPTPAATSTPVATSVVAALPTVTITVQPTNCVAAPTAAATLSPPAASSPAGANLQKFTTGLANILAPAVTVGGRGFQVAGSDSALNIGAALQRSCDIQHNKCANFVNSSGGKAGFNVGDCDKQDAACVAAR